MKQFGAWFLFLGLVLAAGAQERPTLNVSCLQTNEPLAPLLVKVLAEAGFTVTLSVLPAERSYRMMQDGQLDLEFFRTDLSLKENPRLVKIPVALSRVEYRAYTTDPALVIRKREDLRPYKVGYARGNKTLEALLAGYQTYPGVSSAALLQMLELGRLQVVITNQVTYQYIVNQNPSIKLIPQNPPLLVESAYGVLHQSQARLKPVLEKVFGEWVNSGRWQTELQAVLNHPKP